MKDASVNLTVDASWIIAKGHHIPVTRIEGLEKLSYREIGDIKDQIEAELRQRDSDGGYSRFTI